MEGKEEEKIQQEIKEKYLSKSSIQTLNTFSRQVSDLKYPVRLKNSNLSIRSLMSFFYEYQPDKVLSLKIQNIFTTEEQDIFVFSIQQFVDTPGALENRGKLPNEQKLNIQFQGIPRHQDIICKQLVAIYDMINSQNTHNYVKDPYTLNNNIYSNGFPIASLVFIHSHILHQLKNSFNLYIIDAFFNLQNLQDILRYDEVPLRQIRNQLQAIQISNSNIYVDISLLDEQRRKKAKQFMQNSGRFTVSRYSIQEYIILFTDMAPAELRDHISSLQPVGAEQTQFFPHSFNLLEQRLGIYTAVHQGFLITNILTLNDTIAYSMPDGLLYQFDINSIFYMLSLQLLLKKVLQIDFQQPEPIRYVQMLENIQKPEKSQIHFNHKIFIPSVVKYKKNNNIKPAK